MMEGGCKEAGKRMVVRVLGSATNVRLVREQTAEKGRRMTHAAFLGGAAGWLTTEVIAIHHAKTIPFQPMASQWRFPLVLHGLHVRAYRSRLLIEALPIISGQNSYQDLSF